MPLFGLNCYPKNQIALFLTSILLASFRFLFIWALRTFTMGITYVTYYFKLRFCFFFCLCSLVLFFGECFVCLFVCFPLEMHTSYICYSPSASRQTKFIKNLHPGNKAQMYKASVCRTSISHNCCQDEELGLGILFFIFCMSYDHLLHIQLQF